MRNWKAWYVKALYVLLTVGAMIVASGAPAGPGGSNGG